MAASSVNYRKIPLGDPNAPVTAEVLDRIQQRIQEMAQSIPVPTAPNVVSVSSDYQVTGNEDVLHVDSQAGPVRITLLQPSSSNRPLTIKQVNLQNGKSRVNAVTIRTGDGSKTIAGASSYALDNSGSGSVSLTSDDQQHWPSAGAGGNPPVSPTPTPVPPYVPPAPPAPQPPAPITPWIAPVPYGTTNVYQDSTGGEVWKAECMVDFSAAPGTITAYWWFESSSSAGNAIFNIRIGGSANRALDGAIAVTFTETATTPTPRSTNTPISTPAGLQRVTLTVQSSAAGQSVQMSAVNLSFR